MGALWYLELRYARHNVVSILRSPARLALWLGYAIFIGFLAYRRFAQPHGEGRLASALSPEYATAIGGLYLGVAGLTTALVAGGRITIFRNSAEAIIFSNAGIRPLTVAIWLQFRKLSLSSTRWIGTLLYIFVVFAPHATTGGQTPRAFLAAVLTVAVLLTAELPVFLLSRGPLYAPLRAGGWMVAVVGFGYALVGVLGEHVRSPALAALRLDPGYAVTAVAHGDPLALIVGAALLVSLVASIVLLGDDALPELYAASQRRLEGIRGVPSPVTQKRYADTTSAQPSRVPAGALAMIWKDWVGFKRDRGIVRLWLMGAVFWAACGATTAYAALRFNDAASVVALATITLFMLLVSAPLGASLSLAQDLSKPLFWLSSAPLRTRIAAWTFGRTWRTGIALGLAPLAAAFVANDAILALLALPLSFAACWSLQALGVGLFALFPNPIDARGPLLLVRLAITAAFVFPPALIAMTIEFMRGDTRLAIGAAAVVLAAQGWAVVELASLRFEERGAAIATLSRTT